MVDGIVTVDVVVVVDVVDGAVTVDVVVVDAVADVVVLVDVVATGFRVPLAPTGKGTSVKRELS